MRVRITMPAKDGKRIKDKMLALISKVEDDEMGDEWELVRAPSWKLKEQSTNDVSRTTIGGFNRSWIVQINR